MKKHEPKYIEVEGIMRACYDSFLKTGNKAYSDIIALAEAVPAADVQEVKHGRWIKNDGRYGWHCSVCGEDDLYAFAWNCDTGENELQDRYCPNCGSRMDLGEETK